MEPEDLRLVVEYVYCGEVRVSQERLDSVMAVAEVLGIRGLLTSGPQPSKKRRLYEEGGGEAVRPTGVITSSSSSASNGGQARSPVVSRPATARAPLSTPSSQQRSGGTADITDNFNDIRPDILEMIKEEQKVSHRPVHAQWSSVIGNQK